MIRTADNFNIDDIERGREILTDFVRAVHRETQAAAKRRGHPVQLAVRVPAKPEFAHGLGFDVVAWAREGLVDMVIPSDYWNGFADLPVEEWRAQIGVDKRQCRIVPFTGTTYACTKGWMVNVMSLNLAAMRGFAASMLDRGADGIYFFNNFQPVDSPVLLRTPEGKEVVDCQVADLLRAASDLPGAMANARVHAVSIYETLPPKSTYQQVLPAEITPQKSLTLKIHTGPKPATGRCVIRVGLDKSDDLKSAQLAVRLNGSACRALEDLPAPVKPEPRKGLPRMNVCEVAPRLAQFEAPLDAVVRGYNAVELTVEHGGPQTGARRPLRLKRCLEVLERGIVTRPHLGCLRLSFARGEAGELAQLARRSRMAKPSPRKTAVYPSRMRWARSRSRIPHFTKTR